MLKDYKCPSCNNVQEEYTKTTDPNPKCKKCGTEMEAVISTSYKIRMDDYRNRPTGKRYT